MNDNDNSEMNMLKAATVIAMIPIGIGIYIWHAYVTTILWSWFVSSQFGLPELTITQAMGIGLIVLTFTTSFARSSEISTTKNWSERSAELLGKQIGLSLTMLLMGWIIRMFM